MVPGAKTSHFFPSVAAAALEVLRQQVSTEELKRYMRKLHDRQLNPEQAELVTFELVYSLAERVCCFLVIFLDNRPVISQYALLSSRQAE